MTMATPDKKLLHANHGEKSHGELLTALILESDLMVLCSGWLKYAGLTSLLPSIDSALRRRAQILVYSNSKHTDARAARALADRATLKHVIAHHADRYLHTKLYYFERGDSYTAVVGSANLTAGGLANNEELSIIMKGVKGDAVHEEIASYLAELPGRLEPRRQAPASARGAPIN